MIFGLDCSAWSGPLDVADIAATKAFVYHQATDGVGTVDKMLLTRANWLRAAGMGDRLGAYHFLRVRHEMRQDADEQAKQFMDARANAGCTLIPWLDVELGPASCSNRAATHDEVRAAVELFVTTWLRCLGGSLAGYSSPGEMAAMGLDKVDAFTSLPLALARYLAPPGQAPAPPTHDPPLPAPFTSWAFWQYGGNVHAEHGCVDLVAFNGTLDDLQSL